MNINFAMNKLFDIFETISKESKYFLFLSIKNFEKTFIKFGYDKIAELTCKNYVQNESFKRGEIVIDDFKTNEITIVKRREFFELIEHFEQLIKK